MRDPTGDHINEHHEVDNLCCDLPGRLKDLLEGKGERRKH